MNTPSFQPDPTDHPSGRGKQTSDYRANQLQDAAARTTRVERARLEKLWNQHLDGEMAADSKAEFEALCKRYPDLSRELRSTGMLLSGMNLLTADVPASPVAERERTAAILAAVQAERPFVSASEARALRRQRWILVGSAVALLVAVVAADRLFPGWIDPAGMTVGKRGTEVSAAAVHSKSASESAIANQANDASTAAQVASTPAPAAKSARRDALNAKAQLTLGNTRANDLKLTTDVAPTMASQSAIAAQEAHAFGLQSQETWLLDSISRGGRALGPFVASARLRLTDPVMFSASDLRPRLSDTQLFDGSWMGILNEPARADDLRHGKRLNRPAK